MNCSQCGTQVPPGTLICPTCGDQLQQPVATGSAQQGIPPPPAAIASASPNSTLAVVSLVCGIGSWVVLPLIGAIVAIVTGHMARKEIRLSGGRVGGDGLAMGGLVTGYLNLAVSCVGLSCFIAVALGAFGAAMQQH